MYGIFGICTQLSNSLGGSFGSRFWIEDWGYPALGVYFAHARSCRHDMFALDYRDCGPTGDRALSMSTRTGTTRSPFWRQDSRSSYAACGQSRRSRAEACPQPGRPVDGTAGLPASIDPRSARVLCASGRSLPRRGLARSGLRGAAAGAVAEEAGKVADSRAYLVADLPLRVDHFRIGWRYGPQPRGTQEYGVGAAVPKPSHPTNSHC